MAHSSEREAVTVMWPSPPLLYGTAWKEERTEELTRLALQAGFRGIDTANQRKHYVEAGVGAALASFLGMQGAGQAIERSQIFLQSKFTFVDGQDQRLPYDASAPVWSQVTQSFESSLEHLRTSYLDSYLLHGPTRREGLAPADLEAWSALEALLECGKTRHIGISNVSAQQLEQLLARAKYPPAFVQNRCYASQAWDRACREVCSRHGIVYQGFSLLTANRRELKSAAVTRIARRLQVSVPEVVFQFALRIGILPLTGTSQAAHMRQDLASCELELTEADVASLTAISV